MNIQNNEENRKKLATDVVELLDQKTLFEYAIEYLLIEYQNNPQCFQNDWQQIYEGEDT